MPEPELEFDDLAHRYTLDGVTIPSCTQILAAMGCTPGFNWLTPEQLQFYRDRGHAVHKAVELSIQSRLDRRTLDKEEVAPYLTGWERFCKDHKAKAAFDKGEALVEVPLCHPLYRYGVKPDVIGSVDGEAAVIEIKATSAHAPATGLQLAAQVIAVRQFFGGKYTPHRIGLRLLKEEPYYDMRHYTERSDEAVFLSLLNSFNWLTQHKLLKENR